MVPDEEEFWGDSWEKLCELREMSKLLTKKCKASYEKYSFSPNYHYFKCFDCDSSLLSIQQDPESENLFFQCERCELKKPKDELIENLGTSACYRDTHRIISFLTLYTHRLDDKELPDIRRAVINNDQVSNILGDKDIEEFVIKIFGTEDYEDICRDITQRRNPE